MADMISIVNGILAEGSTQYASLVPSATRSNIASVADPILTYAAVQNEFLTALLNKVAMSVIYQKTLTNPMAILKKGGMPLGADVEEIFVNMAQGVTFDPTGATLLTQHKPDVYSMYHRLNRKDQFPVTVSRQQLQTAFVSWDALEQLTTAIINSLYSGDNLAEFVLMKNLIADAITASEMVTVAVTQIEDADTATDFIKAIQNGSSFMTFASSSFNKYSTLNEEANPIVTWTPVEDQILLIRADILNAVKIDVLAAAFNLSMADFKTQVLPVDNFGAATTCYAVLCDKAFFQVYDNLNEMSQFINPQALATTFYWNHWQTMSLSYFANAVAFCMAGVALTAFDSIPAIDGGDTGDPVYATAAAVIAALPRWASANGGDLIIPISTWVDTDTYNPAANASYTFTGTVGTLPPGVTNGSNYKPTVEIVVASAG
jgi:hypothetical protein